MATMLRPSEGLTAARWQQVKLIVAEALEADPAARKSLVTKACAGDATLESEVNLLLAQDAQAIEDCAAGTRTQLQEDDSRLIGQRLGSYQIARELGRGGMGAVYLAARADGQFDKQVAIKVLKRGTDTDEVLRRFRAERQILARLDHPNLARLLDAGTTADGLPYFVMDYVVGTPLTQYATEHDLSIAQRLQLFQEVCSAVSYAHRNLVIHRDIKPSNVLVTKEGEVRLLDFGIARLVESESELPLVTITMLRVMTPEYASPEQVKGDPVTTVSDVYSLGVVLYELLAGERPYKLKRGSAEEVSKAICEQEPVRPSTAVAKGNGSSKLQVPSSKLLRGDLDNIVLKALQKEPQRRYPSVDLLSDDIRRHLEGLPVRARRDTFSYRTGKFVRRHKLGVAAAVLVLLALLAGVVATSWQAHKARLAESKAEQRFAQVRKLAHSVLFDYHDAIATLPGSTAVRERLAKDAREYLDNLSREAGNDRSLLRELATAYEKVGQIQGNSYFVNLGDTDGAMSSYRKSLTIREDLLAADPNNKEIQSELAGSYEGVGDMLYTIGDLRGGLKEYEHALLLRKNVFAANPVNLPNRLSLAELYVRIGDIKGMEIYSNLGDTAGALESYRNAEDLLETRSDADPQNHELRATLTSVLMRVGMLSDTMGNVGNALEKERKAIALLEELAASFPNNKSYRMDLLEANSFLRYALVDNNQIEEAIELSRKTIATLQSMSASDPKEISVRRDLEVTYNALGEDLLTSGDVVGALENHHKALSISEALLTADPNSEVNKSDMALTLERLGEAQAAARDFRSALENYRKALEIKHAILANDASNARARNEISVLYADIANALNATGDIEGADASDVKAVSLAEEVSTHSPMNAKLRANLALRYLEGGRLRVKIAQARNGSADSTAQWKVARDWLQRSLSIWQEMKTKGTLRSANARKPDELAKEIANCDSALNSIESKKVP